MSHRNPHVLYRPEPHGCRHRIIYCPTERTICVILVQCFQPVKPSPTSSCPAQGHSSNRDTAARWPDSGWHLPRSEEHTSELQSRFDLVCRLLLENKNHALS